MRKLSIFKGAPLLALAAALVLLAPGAPLAQAASRRANIELLTAQLPNGENLSTASIKNLRGAVRAAVAKRPADAADLVRIAILAKKARRQLPRCEDVRAIVEAAIAGAPDRSREISEMALALAPDCAAAIDDAVRGGITTGATNARSAGSSDTDAAVPGTTSGDETTGAVSGGDFGGGFGPGFPGSPTFGGSSPSGGFALPPLPTPVTGTTTSVVND